MLQNFAFASTRSLVCSTLAISMVAIAGRAQAQATFIDLGVIPTGTTSIGKALNIDGTIATGSSAHQGFLWTASGGLQGLGTMGGGYSWGESISDDGSAIAGGTQISPTSGYRAYRWTTKAGFQNLGLLPNTLWSFGYGISNDGTTVVGMSETPDALRAFRWTEQTGMVDLGSLPGGEKALAFDVSADGSKVVGWASTGLGAQPFLWTEATGMQHMGNLLGAARGEARAISADGLVVTGEAALPGGSDRAFRWTQAGGAQNLGLVDGTSQSVGHDVSGDGSVIVGRCLYGDFPNFKFKAFLWTEALGMVDLNVYLPTLGIDLTGWELTETHGVSTDGTAIIGQGFYNGVERGWLVQSLFHDTCIADCDGSGTLSIDDFVCFQTLFAMGDPAADCDQDGSLLIDDFICFQTQFAVGC